MDLDLSYSSQLLIHAESKAAANIASISSFFSAPLNDF